jgi:undecaprenyl-diphosphatase
MSEILKSIILGIVQGVTEFLPVSSSGHLELAKFIMGNESVGEESLLMTVVLHFGTALATVFVFRKDIQSIIQGLFTTGASSSRPFAYKIILSMLPAAIVGVMFESLIETFFNNKIGFVCAMLIVTAILLLLASRARYSTKEVGYKEALIIGIAQAVAILPGLSRSGATIATSVLIGVDKGLAARFSFLMVVPLIFGKIAKDLIDGDFSTMSTSPVALVLGFIAAFLTGVVSCNWMITIVKTSKLQYFSIYCFVVGVLGLVYWGITH